jgi:Zn finger protein HypA/HybF involved in hydrogenase expression
MTMSSVLERRVEALEQAGGGGECPRCSGTTVIIVNDELSSVTKGRRLFTPEEARAFVEEEEDGRCPVCGSGRGPEIVVGWYGRSEAGEDFSG